MEYTLTVHKQYSKQCKDGKHRNYILFFLNGIQILKQKIPFDTDWSPGHDRRTGIYDAYILNGKIYQTRLHDYGWSSVTKKPELGKERHVSFPLSKKVMEQFQIPKDLKITINETN